jgi:anti-sigma regulatory factor (Ser/Thr protein kinase)
VETVSVAIRIPVVETSQPGEARRAAISMARKMGFDEGETGKVAIVVTEAATNLVKHGGGGEVLLRPLQSGDCVGLEVIAIDRGRGIPNIEESLRDGHSTSGTAGSGLGAIARLSGSYDLYSSPGKGTAILSRFWLSLEQRAKPPIEVDGVSIAIAGEQVCGDDWIVHHSPDGCTILAVDGLGHGLPAADAAREAIQAFEENLTKPAAFVMEAIHARLRSTRGAAAALAIIDQDAQTLRFIGVGNIAAVILRDEGNRHLVSMSGTMGHNVRAIREFCYPWSSQSLLVMHSDGLSARWDLMSYPGLLRRAPGVIAAVLYRDMARTRDDATVIVARPRGIAA